MIERAVTHFRIAGLRLTIPATATPPSSTPCKKSPYPSTPRRGYLVQLRGSYHFAKMTPVPSQSLHTSGLRVPAIKTPCLILLSHLKSNLQA